MLHAIAAFLRREGETLSAPLAHEMLRVGLCLALPAAFWTHIPIFCGEEVRQRADRQYGADGPVRRPAGRAGLLLSSAHSGVLAGVIVTNGSRRA